MNTALKKAVERLLPRVQTPAAYMSGELNSAGKGQLPLAKTSRSLDS